MIRTLVLISLLLVGCQSDQDNSDNLGPFTSPDQIQKAQAESVEKLSPDGIRVNQSVHVAETQEIVTSQGPLTTLLTEWVTNVAEKEERNNLVVLTLIRTVVDYTQADRPTFEFKDVLAFEKLSRQTKSDLRDLTLSRRLFASETPAAKPETLEIFDITFHNLQKSQVTLVPPENVVTSPDCRGLQHCSIEADKINYEIVFHLSDGTRRRHQIEWHISDQVPFFASILKQCASTIVPVDNVRVLVRQCQDVVDFTF